MSNSFSDDDHKRLLETYEEIAQQDDHRGTASDYLLRELEIDFASGLIGPNDTVLDVGCGLGYALTRYAKLTSGHLTGLDYSATMVMNARVFVGREVPDLAPRIDILEGSVDDIPLRDGCVDVVTSHRCLMALLDWERQKRALVEIWRVLAPGGLLVLMEGTIQGLEKLNRYRAAAGLTEIRSDGRDRLLTQKLDEEALLDFAEGLFDLRKRQGFGTYYFVGRVVHPLLVHPDPPKYDSPINEVARQLQLAIPDAVDCGHLQGFVFRKRLQ